MVLNEVERFRFSYGSLEFRPVAFLKRHHVQSISEGPEDRRGRSSCLVYCSTPIDLNPANFEIFTGVSPILLKLSIFDTSI